MYPSDKTFVRDCRCVKDDHQGKHNLRGFTTRHKPPASLKNRMATLQVTGYSLKKCALKSLWSSGTECYVQLKLRSTCKRVMERGTWEKTARDPKHTTSHLSNTVEVVLLWLKHLWLPLELAHLCSLMMPLLTAGAG